jgi:hypothetical protein
MVWQVTIEEERQAMAKRFLGMNWSVKYCIIKSLVKLRFEADFSIYPQERSNACMDSGFGPRDMSDPGIDLCTFLVNFLS